MAVRIKTISNDVQGVKKPEQRNADHSQKASNDSHQVNKILELEWEALGKKLKKHVGGSNDGEIARLREQLDQKDEQLRQAENRIGQLKKQLFELQEKQHPQKQPHQQKQPQSQKQSLQQKQQHPQKSQQQDRHHAPASRSQESGRGGQQGNKQDRPASPQQHRPNAQQKSPAGQHERAQFNKPQARGNYGRK